jgi:phage-related protein
VLGTGIIRVFPCYQVERLKRLQFADVIYVLHAFQKKSKRGIATPQRHRSHSP